MAQPREQWLDTLRGLAASAVVVQHALESSPAWLLGSQRFFNLGLFGVTLFFLASGYIIPQSLERGGLRPFWIGRFFRLYPLYWASLLLALPFYAKGWPPGHIAANFTMLQEWLGIPHVLELYWTLSTELFFYALVSLLFLLPGYNGSDKRRLLCAVLAAFALLTIVNAVTQHTLPLGRFENLVALFTGLALAQHRQNPERGRFSWPLIGLLGVLLAAAAWVRFPAPAQITADLAPTFSWPCALASWGAAYLLFALAFAWRARAFPRFFLLLGSASYGMYLLHPLVMLAARPDRPLLPQAVIVWLLTVALATLSWHFFEWPLIRLGKRWARNGGSGRPPSQG